ncbi:MAG: M3 family metallopeptidase, partial [Bacteroidales bacterium]|nr:M3 family metallopeptidase [Bacteroidales bacterium]
ATPFQAPAFDKISLSHYLPAFKEGMRLQNEEIAAIIANEDAPTFENTIAAFDTTGEMLDRVSSVFYNMSSANTSKELQAIADTVSPLLSAHRDEIIMNPALFKKVKEVYDNKDRLSLNEEQQRLLDFIYDDFVRNGALLNDPEKEQLKEINEKLAGLTLKFGQNVLAEDNNFTLYLNKDDLSGLPENVKSAAAEAAKSKGEEGKYLFTLQKPSLIPFITYADNRDLREKMYKGYINRGNNDDEFDNKEILLKIANLRLQRANILGYDNHATFVLEKNMAKTPEKVDELLTQLMDPALALAKEEVKMMQEIIDREGGAFQLAPWDWWYYAEKVRKDKYDLDEEELRPYFVMENVREGSFEVAKRLYGLTFTKRNDIPLYHDDVEVFEVTEKNKHIGLLYLDYHPRESKRGGAWCTGYRGQRIRNGQHITPLVSIVCNFSKPTADKPALLTYEEVETFFHEFGHALHGLLRNITYGRTAWVPRDFVELPSQIMEHWAGQPEVMKMYAKHYETNEVIPDALIEKIEKSSKFNQGFVTVEFVAAALLDMGYHACNNQINSSVKDFEKMSAEKMGLIDEITFRYRSTYFQHIFSGGYSSGYYSYMWSEILDTDAFEAFKANGIFDKETADKFRTLLSSGGTKDPMELYVNFRGREPSLEPLLKNRGLL